LKSQTALFYWYNKEYAETQRSHHFVMNFENLGLQIPRFLLPKQGLDLTKWAVVACDQFTSQPEYWAQVERYVDDAPSTLRLVFPEVYLGKPGEDERIRKIQETMRSILDQGMLESFEGLVYVERRVGASVRHGLLLCLDLEQYDYHAGAKSLIRATEGTILERLPPRMHIRRGAPLELPHILVLIDDPMQSVIEPLAQLKPNLAPLYDFDLMFNSGHLAAWLVQEKGIEQQILKALSALADPQEFASKYGLDEEQPVLLFAMGDGNHSLAAAKAIWEEMKSQVGMGHLSRYALVEIENVHDPALQFRPIHRLLFDLQKPLLPALRSFFQDKILSAPCASFLELARRVDGFQGVGQAVGLVVDGRHHLLQLTRPDSNLPAGTVQAFLDAFMEQGGAKKIDYVHGEEVISQLGDQVGNAGFYLPPMPKGDLFKTVIVDGVLPRKTFSMGEAKEKRFYMEARKIF
jgi:hypothetical protein